MLKPFKVNVTKPFKVNVWRNHYSNYECVAFLTSANIEETFPSVAKYYSLDNVFILQQQPLMDNNA